MAALEALMQAFSQMMPQQRRHTLDTTAAVPGRHADDGPEGRWAKVNADDGGAKAMSPRGIRL